MEKLVLFCKSYRGDLLRTVSLLNSIKKHNRDNIPVYISVPVDDFYLFKSSIGVDYVQLLVDESIADQLVTEKVGGITSGYINQEIVKLSFWKLGVAENYFCLDSDGYFIRDFGYGDFMYDDNTPYSVLVEDKELWIDPDYQSYWIPRYEKIMAIKDLINYQDARVLTCHGFTTFSSIVLQSFEEEFLIPNKLTLIDVLEIAPYEYSWYNFWLQKEKIIKVVPCEPLFKVFHYKKQYIEARKKGVAEADIARAYLGIVLNSNWNKDARNLRYIDPASSSNLPLVRFVHKSFLRIKRITKKCIAKFQHVV